MNSTTAVHHDVSELIEQASRIAWERNSPDEAIELLRPALEKRNCQAYRAAIDFLISGDRLSEAATFAKMLVSHAQSDYDFSTINLACEAHIFEMLGLDEKAIHRDALLTLANRENPVVQTEIALHHLRGTEGFERSDSSFLKWIERAIRSSSEIDPVCYLVEYAIEQGLPIESQLLDRLRAAAELQPNWKDIQVLLRKTEISRTTRT